MSILPRAIVLGVCSAIGVGVAICLAITAESKPLPKIKSANRSLSTETVEPKSQPLPTLLALPTAPSIAPISPIVSQQVPSAPLPDTTASDRQAEVVNGLLEVLKLQAAGKTASAAAPSEEESEEEPTSKPLAPAIVNAQQRDEESEALPPPNANEPRLPIVEQQADHHGLRIVVQDSDIRDVLELLSEQGELNILATKNVTGTVSATLAGVDVESALAAILRSTGFVARREGKYVYVGTPEDFLTMDQSRDRIVTRVYRPNYVRAAELQTLITPLITTGVGKVTVSTPSQVDIPASQTQTGGDGMPDVDVVIVRDYERVLMQIDQLVLEVDRRPRQVRIDAMIMSVKLSDENKFGVDFQALKNRAHIKAASGSPPGTVDAVTFTDGGLKLAFIDGSISALMEALESVGETNVVAAPRLMCLNKQRAEIQIGEQLGYVSTTVTETSSTQSIQFLDVGTLLRLRPFISEDGTIRMEVHPELSTGSVSVNSGLTLPTKEVTQVTTNVMCQNGSTVIIGGLIREDLQNDTDQVPILGDIPIAGWLFKQKTAKIDRREILVLITPRLIDEPCMTEEGVRLGNEFLRRQSVVFDKLSPISRRYWSQQHLRRARAAWAAGDAENALKHCNLAIEHDPLSREAVVLRDEVACVAAPDESVHEYLRQGLKLWDRPHKDYSKQGSPWKDGDPLPSGQFVPVESFVPGEPPRTMRIEQPPPDARAASAKTPVKR